MISVSQNGPQITTNLSHTPLALERWRFDLQRCRFSAMMAKLTMAHLSDIWAVGVLAFQLCMDEPFASEMDIKSDMLDIFISTQLQKVASEGLKES